VRRFLERASEVGRRFGLGGLVRAGLDKGVLRPLSLNVMHVVALDLRAVRSVAVDPAFDFRILDPAEIARFAAEPANELEAEFVERARRGLDLCFGAVRDGRLAVYAWFALDSAEGVHAAGVDLGLPSDTAYLYKGFTPPDFRGRDLYPACLVAAVPALRPRGIERVIAFVRWSNEAALRGCRRAGFRRLGRLVVGPRGRVRIPPGARAVGVRFGREAADALAARRSSDPA
jgi:ribosomal protein S18 acetylase RimI-like enzyme